MNRRLESLDALRGFDMLWIVGGTGLIGALAEDPGGSLLGWMAEQSEHPEWHGFALYDLIFPLFLFLAGVSLPFSLAHRRERGDGTAAWGLHVARRTALLLLFGAIYNGLLRFELADQRYASVLGRIGLAWAGAAWITSGTGVRARFLWIAGLWLGYWAALTLVPVPGFGAGDLRPGHTLTDWFDRARVPGRLHRGERDPEGLFATLPAIGTALVGAQAGELLRRARDGAHASRQLAVAALACAAGGWLWSFALPWNKNLWTSSFALWCGGLSLALLAAFHYAIDVRGFRRLGGFFAVFGSNAIAVYLGYRFVDWHALVQLVLHEQRVHPAGIWIGVLAVQWLFFRALYRRRIFLRV